MELSISCSNGFHVDSYNGSLLVTINSVFMLQTSLNKKHLFDFGMQVPFFSDDEETPSTPKADALFIPRENPRALVIRPLEQWPPRKNADKSSPFKDTSSSAYENGKFFFYFASSVQSSILGMVITDNSWYLSQFCA